MYDFLNLFLQQGCLFKTDRVLPCSQEPCKQLAKNMRRHAEFFADFCVQEQELVFESAFFLAAAVLAFTRKHLNLEIIWPKEMEILC
jgi:hypothetical protein